MAIVGGIVAAHPLTVIPPAWILAREALPVIADTEHALLVHH